MLILTRKRGESIVIGGNVVVTFMGLDTAGRAKIGISAPDEVPIMRQELLALEMPKPDWFKGVNKAKPVSLEGHFFACGDCPPCTGGRPDQCVYRVKIEGQTSATMPQGSATKDQKAANKVNP